MCPGRGMKIAVAGMTRSRELFIGYVAPCRAELIRHYQSSRAMYLSLSSSGPVKWNHNQESSLLQDVSPFSPAYDGRAMMTLDERIRELYLQFLWLPEVRVVLPLFAFFSVLFDCG